MIERGTAHDKVSQDQKSRSVSRTKLEYSRSTAIGRGGRGVRENRLTYTPCFIDATQPRRIKIRMVQTIRRGGKRIEELKWRTERLIHEPEDYSDLLWPSIGLELRYTFLQEIIERLQVGLDPRHLYAVREVSGVLLIHTFRPVVV